MTAAARWLPASGLAAALALALTGLISPPPPVAGAAANDVVAYYRAHGFALEIESVIDAAGVMLLVLFAATLHARFKSSASLTGLAMAAVLAACTLVEVAAFQSLAYRSPSDPILAATLGDFQSFAFEVTTFPALVFLAASGVAILQSGDVARWLAFAAFAAALIQPVAWISFFAPSGPLAVGGIPDIVSFVALLAWLVAASLRLLVGGRRVGAGHHPRPA